MSSLCRSEQKATVNKIYQVLNKGVIPVKNITAYTVAPNVAKSQNTTSLLSQLKEFSRLDNSRIRVTRDFWSNELDVNRKTIQRWEDELIDSTLWFLSSSYWNGGSNKSGLDCYQRFLLSLICSMKKGVHPFTEKMTYKDILKYMCSPTGSPFWMSITREKFSQIEEVYSRKAG